MFELLALNAAILLVLVLIQWAISVTIDDVSFIDAFWGAGMGILAVASWLHVPGGPGELATLIMLMTAAWGFRLGIYLFLRWRKEGEDKRYKLILKKDREAGRFAQAALTRVWLMQAVLLFAVSSPAQVGILASPEPAPILPLAWAGFGLWCVGVFFEWVGDWQLTRFKRTPPTTVRCSIPGCGATPATPTISAISPLGGGSGWPAPRPDGATRLPP